MSPSGGRIAHNADDPVLVFSAGSVDDGAGQSDDVTGIVLRHDSGLEVTLLSYGAGLAAVRVPNSQRPGEAVLVTHAPVDLDSLQTVAGRYVGASIGRFANRIAGATFELDGVRHRLDPNESPNHLHGGPRGFSSRVWDHELLDDSLGARFSLVSDDGDGGYPGTLLVSVTYLLFDHELVIEYRATADAPTPINLTNHAYWNLAGPEAVPTIAEHRLRILPDRVLLTDDAGIPLPGPPVAVAGTRFDLDRTDDLRSTLAAGGLDHCFVGDRLVGTSGTGEPAIVLEHPATGRRLRITTDQPGIQVYTGDHFEPPYQSIAFEPQAWPDSPNRADFPSTILRPGETYTNRSTYRFDW